MGRNIRLRIALLFLLAGVMFGIVAWRCVRSSIAGNIALSLDIAPGSHGFSRDIITSGSTGGWEQPVCWLEEGRDYVLPDIAAGAYNLKISLVIPPNWNSKDQPINITTSEGKTPVSIQEVKDLPLGGLRILKCKANVYRTASGSVAVQAVHSDAPIGLTMIRIRNFSFYDKKLGYFVFRSSAPALASRLSINQAVLFILFFGVLFFFIGFSFCAPLPSARIRTWLTIASLAGPFLMLATECASVVFTNYRLFLTPLGMFILEIGFVALGWGAGLEAWGAIRRAFYRKCLFVVDTCSCCGLWCQKKFQEMTFTLHAQVESISLALRRRLAPLMTSPLFEHLKALHLPPGIARAWKRILSLSERLSPPQPKGWRAVLWAVFILLPICVSIFSFAASYDPGNLWNDEVIYMGVVECMVNSGNFLTPCEDGIPFFHKPPFGLYWPAALLCKWFGLSPLTIRLTPWIYGTLLVAICYALASRMGGFFAGIAAAGILLTTPLFHYQYTTFMFETPLAFWEIVTILIALKPGALSRLRAIIFGLSLGLTIMVKGAACAPLVLWLALFVSWRWKDGWFRWDRFFPALFTTALVVLPWHIYSNWRHSGQFWQEYWIYQVMARYSSGFDARPRGWSYYSGLLFQFARPWCFIYPISLVWVWTWKEERFWVRPLSLFAVFVFFFYCSSRTQYQQYVFPILPIVAVTTGCLLVRVCPLSLRWGFFLLPLAGLLVAKQVDQIKEEGARHYEQVAVARYLDRNWPARSPAFFAGVLRKFPFRHTTDREIREFSEEDLSTHLPFLCSSPFVINEYDLPVLEPNLLKSGLTKSYQDKRYTVFSWPQGTPCPQPASEGVTCPTGFVDLDWSSEANALLALRKDGELWLCDAAHAATRCAQIPNVDPILPARKILRWHNGDLAILHETGEVSVLGAGKEGNEFRFDEITRLRPWPSFKASRNLRAVDCAVSLEDPSKDALLLSDGRVWVGDQNPRLINRYACFGNVVSLIESDHSGFWFVMYSENGIGGFPGREPGGEAAMRPYSVQTHWGAPRAVEAQRLPDGQIAIVNQVGDIEAVGPGKKWKISSSWAPSPRVSFHCRDTGHSYLFSLLDEQGGISQQESPDY